MANNELIPISLRVLRGLNSNKKGGLREANPPSGSDLKFGFSRIPGSKLVNTVDRYHRLGPIYV